MIPCQQVIRVNELECKYLPNRIIWFGGLFLEASPDPEVEFTIIQLGKILVFGRILQYSQWEKKRKKTKTAQIQMEI